MAWYEGVTFGNGIMDDVVAIAAKDGGFLNVILAKSFAAFCFSWFRLMVGLSVIEL